jgi:hypothetical protein
MDCREGCRARELSEGTKGLGEPVLLVPSPSPGWTWPLRFSDPGFGISEASLDDGQLYLLALLVSGVPQVWPAPSFDPDPVPFRFRLRPKPSTSPWGLDPAFRPLRSEDRP